MLSKTCRGTKRPKPVACSSRGELAKVIQPRRAGFEIERDSDERFQVDNRLVEQDESARSLLENEDNSLEMLIICTLQVEDASFFQHSVASCRDMFDLCSAAT